MYELGRELSVPLGILFNKSFELGKIPLEWKNANVVAVFTKSNPGNYRPVSLTCVTCKILESVIRDANVEHMNDYTLYGDCQHEFRKRRSCVTQLLQGMEDLSLLVENGCDIDVIYFDFMVPSHESTLILERPLIKCLISDYCLSLLHME